MSSGALRDLFRDLDAYLHYFELAKGHPPKRIAISKKQMRLIKDSPRVSKVDGEFYYRNARLYVA